MPAGPNMQPNVIATSDLETVDVLGSEVQFIPLATEVRKCFCLLRGTIPGGGAVPLHSHDSFETFTVISGEFEALVAEGDHPGSLPLVAGEILNVPGGVRHAFRNRS
jgi:mannose-6-phosphate isomerase-like protein (cupin superfamily)